MRVLFGFLILLFLCKKESATTSKRIFEKIILFLSFVAQAFSSTCSLIFLFWKNGRGVEVNSIFP